MLSAPLFPTPRFIGALRILLILRPPPSVYLGLTQFPCPISPRNIDFQPNLIRDGPAPFSPCLFSSPLCTLEHSVPTRYADVRVLLFGAAMEIVFCFTLVICKLTMDGRNLIGVHVFPTALFVIGTLNAHFIRVGSSIKQTRAALKSPLARGDKTPEEIDAQVAKLTRSAFIANAPLLALDLPLLVSSMVTPDPRNDPLLEWKRWVWVARMAQMLHALLTTIWYSIHVTTKMKTMFAEILAMPMDEGPRQQVVGLRDRVVAGQRGFARGSLIIGCFHFFLMIPVSRPKGL